MEISHYPLSFPNRGVLLPCLASLAWPYVALPHQFTCTFFPNLTNLHHLLLTFSPAHTHHTHTQRLIPPNHALLLCAPFQSEEFSPLLTRLDPSLTSSFLYFIFRALFHRPNPCRLLIPSPCSNLFRAASTRPLLCATLPHRRRSHLGAVSRLSESKVSPRSLSRFFTPPCRSSCSPVLFPGNLPFLRNSLACNTPVISQNLPNRRSSCASSAPAS